MAVNSGCLYLFKGVLGLPLIPASLMAIEIALVHNFIWHRQWTWRDRSRENRSPFLKQLAVYNLATGVVDLVANVTVLWLLTTFLGIYYMIANIAGMVMGPLVKFWLNDKVIFKVRKIDGGEKPPAQRETDQPHSTRTSRAQDTALDG